MILSISFALRELILSRYLMSILDIYNGVIVACSHCLFSPCTKKNQIHLEECTPNSSCINNKEFAQATLLKASRITQRPLCQRLIKTATQQLYYNYPSSHFQKHERFKGSKWKDTALRTLPTSQIQTRCPWRAQRNIVRHHSRALTLTNALLFSSLASLHGSCSKTQIFCCPSSLINTK